MKQKHKIYTLTLLSISLAVIVVIAVIWKSTSRPCGNEPNIYSVYCGSNNFEQRFHPFLISFLTLLPINILLFFVRRETFMAWATFAAVAFPLMLGILWYTYNYTDPITHGFMGGPTESQIATVVLPFLFIFVSIIIIAVKSWKLRGK